MQQEADWQLMKLWAYVTIAPQQEKTQGSVVPLQPTGTLMSSDGKLGANLSGPFQQRHSLDSAWTLGRFVISKLRS